MTHRIASGPVRQKGERRRAVQPVAPEQRQPRKLDRNHLGLVAQLPCVICGAIPVQVAHVRYADAICGASLVGKGEKPSDWRALPLCPDHHLNGPDAQHKSGEAIWWKEHGINPYPLCRALYGAGGDVGLMAALIKHAGTMFPAIGGQGYYE